MEVSTVFYRYCARRGIQNMILKENLWLFRGKYKKEIIPFLTITKSFSNEPLAQVPLDLCGQLFVWRKIEKRDSPISNNYQIIFKRAAGTSTSRLVWAAHFLEENRNER